MGAAAKAVEQVQLHDAPLLDVGVGPPRTAPVDEVLVRIRKECDGLAARVDVIEGREWQRQGRLPSGQQVSTMDLVRHAVHVGTHHRRVIDEVMTTVLFGAKRTGDRTTY